MDKKIALLIDADNVSAKYIKPILDELSKYGNVTCKRIYGDWTNTRNAGWKDELLKNSISPIQQFGYTTGKNATDSAMIIDAMDLLYSQSVEGFCIVSSDSDFTRLAARLRESGQWVIGMGEEKTPQPFRKACDIFTCLELLIEEEALSEPAGTSGHKVKSKEHVKQEKRDSVIEKRVLEESIIRIITENQNSDRMTSLSEVGNRLVKLYPDFDVRSYGYSLLSKLLDDFPRIRLIKDGSVISVELIEDTSAREDVETYVLQLVEKYGHAGIDLGTLGRKVYEQFSGFRMSDYGYTQFNQFVREMAGIELYEEETRLKVRCSFLNHK